MARAGTRGLRKRTAVLAVALATSGMAVAVSAPPASAAGTVSLTTLDVAYTQDFNTLASSGTSTVVPVGWAFAESGTNANTTYTAGTGSLDTGDTYSFGAAASTERAFGGLRSGSLVPLIGASFANDTGATLTDLRVQYTGEQWRLGQNTTGRSADKLDFQISTDATSLTTGTWTDVDGLDFASPVVAGTVGALNGNVAPNQSPLTSQISGLSIPNGTSFWIRWADTDLIPGADDGLSVDDFVLAPTTDTAPTVTSTTPINGATDVAAGSNLTVTFNEPVDVTGAWFALTCAGGPVAATASGGPTTFTIDPTTDLPGGSCTLTVVAANVTDQDTIDPPDPMAADVVVGFSVVNPCAQPFTPIPAIQGTGSTAAITGTVTTQGVVVGDFEGSASQQGFYLQDPAGDGNPATSDGIFVFTGSTANLVSAGDAVRVTGFARERFNQTTLNGSNSNSSAVPAASIVKCGTGSAAPTEVTLPFASLDFPERFEGMLTKLSQPLVIAEYFNYDRFGEIVLALPLAGETRPFTGTAIDEPGAPANARTLANSLRRITLDDANGSQNPSVLRHPNGQPFSLANRFRGGDTVSNTVGVLGYDFSLYRVFPTGPADYTALNPRPASPEPVGGAVRVASLNTLNYFLTADYPTGNPLDNKCGPLNNVECRGWDADQPDELTRQRAKLLAALSGPDADVIGLNELENTTGVEPLADIVAGLPGYDYVDTGTIGTDAIKVGLIYRPAKVTPVGPFQILDSSDDARFLDTKNRPSLAQTFQDVATGDRFTVVANHFKSKGSACGDVGDPDLGDGQGNCSQTRKAAAQALVDWLATDPTGSGDPDFLVMGDLNSYAQEDPIDAVRAGADDTAGTGDDFTNLIATYQGAYAYSYTFDGQAGYLDHALASASLVGQVAGAVDWHINSDEPDVLDYDTSFKPSEQDALYEPNAFRSSDHDPVIVGLDLVNYPPELGGISVSAGLVSLGSAVKTSVPFTDPDELDVHTAVWDWGDGTTSAGTVTEASGSGTITGSHTYTVPGVYAVTVTVDDGYGNTDQATYEFVVVFDPNGAFVTGGGWIDSPAGALVRDPSAAGKATFGFVAKYRKGANVPDGNTTFQFHAGGFAFQSTSYDWLVVAGKKAQYKGAGTVNGESGYTFLLSAVDASPDRLRLKVWNATTGAVVYDNGSDQALGGGSIVVH